MSRAELGMEPPGSITIEQLIALNDEITALVRAGVPLERGLVVAGADIKGRLGQIAGALGNRMSRGENLVQALDGEKKTIPPLYRAVVEAGARSGRLPVALEGLRATSAAIPRPELRSVLRFGIPFWSCRWLTHSLWPWYGKACRISWKPSRPWG